MASYFYALLIFLMTVAAQETSGSHSSEILSPEILHLQTLLQDPAIRDLTKPPILVLTAPQSAGKSLFIEVVVGYPVAYSASGIGTRCPVLYLLRTVAEPSQAACKINGDLVQIDEIASRVGLWMKELARNNSFSDIPLTVEILKPGVPNIDIMDTVGIPAKASPHYDQAIRILQSVLLKPNTIVVALLRNSYGDKQSNFDMQIMDEVVTRFRPHWKNDSIVVENYVNKALPSIHTVDQAETFFKAQSKAHVFVMLNPSLPEENLDVLVGKERHSWLLQLAGKEKERFRLELQRISESDPTKKKFPATLYDRIGVANAKSVLAFHLAQIIKKHLPDLFRRLDDMIMGLTTKEKELQSKLKFENTTEIKILYAKYMRSFTATIRAIYEYQLVTRSEDALSIQPWNYARTWDDEEAMCGSVPDSPVTRSDLNSVLAPFPRSPTGLHNRLDYRLVGHSALTRILTVFGLKLLSWKNPALTYEEAVAACDAGSHGVSGACDSKRMVKHLVSREIVLPAKSLLDWLCDRLNCLYKALGRDTVTLLLETELFRILESHAGLHDHVKSNFENHIEREVVAFKKAMLERIEEQAETFNYDANVRLIALLTQVPHTRICGENPDTRRLTPTPREAAALEKRKAEKRRAQMVNDWLPLLGVGFGVVLVFVLMRVLVEYDLRDVQQASQRALPVLMPSQALLTAFSMWFLGFAAFLSIASGITSVGTAAAYSSSVFPSKRKFILPIILGTACFFAWLLAVPRMWVTTITLIAAVFIVLSVYLGTVKNRSTLISATLLLGSISLLCIVALFMFVADYNSQAMACASSALLIGTVAVCGSFTTEVSCLLKSKGFGALTLVLIVACSLLSLYYFIVIVGDGTQPEQEHPPEPQSVLSGIELRNVPSSVSGEAIEVSVAMKQRCGALEKVTAALRENKDGLSLLDVIEGGVETSADHPTIDINPTVFQYDAERFIFLSKAFLQQSVDSFVMYRLERIMLNQFLGKFEDIMLKGFQEMSDNALAELTAFRKDEMKEARSELDKATVQIRRLKNLKNAMESQMRGGNRLKIPASGIETNVDRAPKTDEPHVQSSDLRHSPAEAKIPDSNDSGSKKKDAQQLVHTPPLSQLRSPAS